jgi:hypothetical protein
MVDLTNSSILGAGLTLIRRRPAAVAVWGLLAGAFVLLGLLLIGPPIFAMIERFHPGATPDAYWPGAVGALMQIQASMLLFNVGGFLVRAVVIAAVFRAILEPEKSAFAYLRIGMAELFIAVLMFGEGVVIAFMAIIVAAPFIVTVVWLALAHYVAGAVATGILGAAVVIGLIGWFALRLSLLGPMIIVKDDFPLAEAWALTRGRVGGLLLIAIVVGLLVMALEVVVGGVCGVFGVAILGGLIHGPQGFAISSPADVPRLLAASWPWLAVAGLVWSLFIGAAAAIFCAPWAAAYRALAAPRPVMAA